MRHPGLTFIKTHTVLPSVLLTLVWMYASVVLLCLDITKTCCYWNFN